MPWTGLRQLLVPAAVVILLLAAGWFLPLQDWIVRFATAIREAGAGGVAVFFAIYVLAAVALLPGSLLTLAAGFAYGPVWGLAIASPASVAGATCAFVLGRTLLYERVARWFEGSPQAAAIRAALEREGFKLVLLLRLSPVVPFNLLNYLLSLTRVRLPHYVAASFLGMLPATAFYVYVGSLASTAVDLAAGTEEAGPWRIALSVIGIAATLMAVVTATRAARRALAGQIPGA